MTVTKLAELSRPGDKEKSGTLACLQLILDKVKANFCLIHKNNETWSDRLTTYEERNTLKITYSQTTEGDVVPMSM